MLGLTSRDRIMPVGLGFRIDLTGNRFGRLVVVQPALPSIPGVTKWICRCDCGTVRHVLGSSLRAGYTKSCGCIQKEYRSEYWNRDDISGARSGRLTALCPLLPPEVGNRGEVVKKWICRCDCGSVVHVSRDEILSGKARSTQSCGCLARDTQPKGPDHSKWEGGRNINSQGYVRIHKPDHPGSNSKGYVLEHRLVMEEHLGRHLQGGENIHHKNGVRDDNRIENLELWSVSQPAGQRVSDRIDFYTEWLESHGYTVIPPNSQKEGIEQ